jgi:AAA+ superfamily predicted ATPase
MTDNVLRLDLGDKYREAKHYARDNPDVTLREFLRVYPARFREPPSESTRDLPISRFTFNPVELKDDEGQTPDLGPPPAANGLRADLDAAWEEEQSRGAGTSPRDREPEAYPETISDNAAVRTAYRHELEAIADFLGNDLSVLVACDKMLTEFIYEYVCSRAGRKVVLDTQEPEQQASGRGMGGRLDQAMGGGQSNPMANLPVLIRNLKPREVLVLRSLDLLDKPPLIEQLYQRTAKGQKPQLLAFLDPSLEAQKVLTDRFAVHIAIMGLPRYIYPDGERAYTVNHMLTREERLRFCEYDPEGLYKNVSGLNAIQFRNAMQYVGATVEPGCDTREIYSVIRRFKTSSSNEIEIPDTDFEDIGGYEDVKRELQRTIDLIAGPMKGIDEEERRRLIPRGFVFHGPPGTGKTLFAKAIANEMNATIQMISGPEIMDKYVGQSENNLRRIFATARRNAPSVVFFDEFDSLASQRSTYADGGARANNAVVAQFLTELDGFRSDQAVLVIGTTNRIDIIDEALLRPSRLRPVAIDLPDYAARQRVAEIHAERFGVDNLLKDLCRLASEHLAAWEASGGQIPAAFLEALFEAHERYQTRYEIEAQRAGFLRELQDFFTFVRDNQYAGAEGDEAQTALLDQMSERLVKVGRRYGLDLDAEELPDLSAEEAEAWLLPMRSDIRDLFAMLLQERRRKSGGLTPETFLSAVMDLVAEYTVDFNNDEIRAIFQEARMEHHMDGQLITPRYIGQKIGLIHKRRDEREASGLSEDRGL